MRILFDLRSVGLGDNGGSLTIIRSANTLVELGHDVIIIDSMSNKHTWNKLIAKHFIPKTVEQIPSADAVIATGYKSVAHTVSLPDRCGKKIHWIRGWENWQIPEYEIIKNILDQPTIKFVNGIGLQKKLKKCGFESCVVRPGYDFDLFYPTNIRQNKKELVLGGLYRTDGIFSEIKRSSWILNTAYAIKQARPNLNIRLWMYGINKSPGKPEIDMYIHRPTIEQKNMLYNNVDVWLAPTRQEGLHMPPAEAMLTECPIVGTNCLLSGMHDYLINEVNGFMTKNTIEDFSEKSLSLVDDKEKRIIFGKNARAKILELGDRKTNMEKMVKLIGEL